MTTSADSCGVQQFALRGDTALITGATGHLGREIATTLAAAGAHVLLNSRSAQHAEELAAALRGKGLQATAAPFDVADAGAIAAAVAQLRERFERIDVLVNNAYTGRPATIETSHFEDFQNAFAVAVAGPFTLLKELLPLLDASGACRRGGASVINIASMYGHVSPDPAIYGSSGQNSAAFYGAAKGGLIQLGRYLAVHLAPRNIRVNTISPGPFPTPATVAKSPQFIAKLQQKNPLGRIGEAGELGGPVLFLASAASAYVTGVNLPVDGGWTCW